ncbi:thioredoxin reductase-like [Condylostylus longicornis]|uniref:thioredoxin reductase-like n=1 Tax=Condylostylus longicornis TaxID=2530218 RepID=UPI00244E092B|nr:thioredoxin reductase-like [Condylostylus longicornis]
MSSYDYDLVVIGGGSGGMAAAKEAMLCGAKKVALFDFVKPTVHGTKWGLGGTCVNVGCIPKKLMHYAASMGPALHGDAPHFGWNIEVKGHDWNAMIDAVQQYVKKLNFSYRVGLRSKKVEYINALGRVEDPHTVSYVKNGETQKLSTKYILIAVGGRPNVPSEEEVPGAQQYAITSDDLFSLKTSPGKTLVVGASYIALECAGFLTELGYPTTVAVRSILLRGFDRQCAEKVGQMMQEMGTRFVRALPTRITKTTSGKFQVEFSDGLPTEEFDTILYATGRLPDTQLLNLEAVGVKLDDKGKIIATCEQSSVPSLFVVGDALSGGLELTPVAIKAGELLVRRLFAGSTVQMDYHLVPTAVFTPFEYGACGMSEEAAIEKYGQANVEVYLFEFPTLEIAAAHRAKVLSARVNEADVELSPNSLTKLVCLKSENERVLGFHFVGMNAGEITQGYSLALKLGCKKSDFDSVVGIHPTDAESFHSLAITRSSGESWVAAGGCGGGKCG